MRTVRRLNDWLEQLSAWRYALTCGTFYFVVLVVGGEAIHWAVKGHLDSGFILEYGFVFSVTMATLHTIGQQRRQRRQRRLARERDDQPPVEPRP